ncbi:MAG TPA: hypothetical protein VGW97_03070, partial [Chthoniobacterales bacterium]|nr:hypothetical protein [Chthoniobacterales bacterium]
SSIYPRAFTNQQTAVSSQVRTIVDAIAAQPRIGRKELADKLIVDLTSEEAERAKMALASDLLWLISAGRVIEFNDGSLDLPRTRAKSKEEGVAAGPSRTATVSASESALEEEQRVEAGAPPADEQIESPTDSEKVVAAAVSAPKDNSTESRPTEKEEPTEIGGS